MKAKILVVDDDKHVADSLRRILQFHGYDTTAVTSGQEGFREAVFQPCDLIFMDMRMPAWNGLEVIRSLRLVNQDVKIIVYSGYVHEFASRLDEEEVDAVLPKPTPAEKIIETVESLLKQGGRTADQDRVKADADGEE